jgi:16S rRNA C1402 N4-methylase RsmH
MGIDQDPAALLMAGKRLHAARVEGRAVLVSGNFEDMGRLAAENGIEKESVDGILLDIGTSSLQLDEASILKSPVYSDFIFSNTGALTLRIICGRLSAAFPSCATDRSTCAWILAKYDAVGAPSVRASMHACVLACVREHEHSFSGAYI